MERVLIARMRQYAHLREFQWLGDAADLFEEAMSMAITIYKDRVEKALPVAMMAALAKTNCFSCYDAQGQVVDAQGHMQLQQIRALLDRGLLEPLQGLPVNLARLCGKHIDRVHGYGCEAILDGQRADKVMMTVYYFLEDLTESGYLELWEGSAVAEAATALIAMVDHAFEIVQLDESAKKQARRIKARYQERGYYVD